MPTAPQHPPLHDTVRAVTDRIRARSAATRAAYVQRIDAAARDDSVERAHLGCTNLAHCYAAAPKGEKVRLLAKVVSVEGATVQLEDGPHKAKATVKGDAALRLVPGTYAILACDVAEPGANLTLDCG